MSDCMTQEDAMNMSNEQAIQILKPFRDMMIDQHGCPISSAVFALDKAIEALSAQEERKNCETCRYNPLDWDEEPCDSCTGDHWKPERKTGKWELIDDTEFRIPGYRCSVCHCECEDWENKPTYNYCPNCGADMRGEQDANANA